MRRILCSAMCRLLGHRDELVITTGRLWYVCQRCLSVTSLPTKVNALGEIP